MEVCLLQDYNYFAIKVGKPNLIPTRPLWLAIQELDRYTKTEILFKSDNECIVKLDNNQYITMSKKNKLTTSCRKFINNYTSVLKIK